MSNPGVKCLASYKDRNHYMSIEDNIGESIHIHYDDIRIDLTIRDFFKLVDKLNDILNKLVDVDDFRIQDYDPIFMDHMSRYIVDLEKIEITEINTSDINVLTKNIIGMPVVKNIMYSRVMKALNGDSSENNRYIQENIFGQDNSKRLNLNYCYVKDLKIDSLIKPRVVFFNDNNIIKDGQHRVCCFLNLYNESVIPIVRMYFKDNMHNFTWKSYLRICFISVYHRILDIIKYNRYFRRAIRLLRIIK